MSPLCVRSSGGEAKVFTVVWRPCNLVPITSVISFPTTVSPTFSLPRLHWCPCHSVNTPGELSLQGIYPSRLLHQECSSPNHFLAFFRGPLKCHRSARYFHLRWLLSLQQLPTLCCLALSRHSEHRRQVAGWMNEIISPWIKIELLRTYNLKG